MSSTRKLLSGMRSTRAFLTALILALVAGCTAKSSASWSLSWAKTWNQSKEEILVVNKEDFSELRRPSEIRPTSKGSEFLRNLILTDKNIREHVQEHGAPRYFKWRDQGGLGGGNIYELYYPGTNKVHRFETKFFSMGEFKTKPATIDVIPQHEGKLVASASRKEVGRAQTSVHPQRSSRESRPPSEPSISTSFSTSPRYQEKSRGPADTEAQPPIVSPSLEETAAESSRKVFSRRKSLSQKRAKASTRLEKVELTQKPEFIFSHDFSPGQIALGGIGFSDSAGKIPMADVKEKNEQGWYMLRNGARYKVQGERIIKLALGDEILKGIGFTQESQVRAKLGKEDDIKTITLRGNDLMRTYQFSNKGLEVNVGAEDRTILSVAISPLAKVSTPKQTQPLGTASKESCFELGKRYGRCSTLVMSGKTCSPADDIAKPQRCMSGSSFDTGIRAGVEEASRSF